MKISDEQLALMKGHTPWPWRAGRPDMLSTAFVTGKFVYSGPKGGPRYVAVAVDDDVPDEQLMPNAHLIAAAPALLSEVLELRAEVTKLRADAERYRWLRDSSDATADDWIGTRMFGYDMAQEIDAAIDAARGAT